MRLNYPAMLCAVALCLSAQEPPRPGFIRFHPLLSALDSNHDGVISSAELQSAPAVLATLDADKNGSVSADQMRPARFGRGQGSEQRPGPGESQPPSASEMVKTLMSFDADGDGKLTRKEVPER